ncbi:MAG TPA: ABC transporter permease [Gemmatimonadales bacterium]|nr:ABC transporter permease [Gemmatimonadales bacterium]
MTVLPTASGRPAITSSSGGTFFGDLRQVVTDIWDFRELLAQLTRRDIKIRYKQAVMGFAWALFMPVLVVAAGLIIRWAISTVGGAPLNRAGAGELLVKGLCWSFFVGAIGFATPSLSGNTSLVTKVYFPREVLPLGTLGAQLFDSGIGAIAVLVATPFLGALLTPALGWVPLLLVLLIAFTAGTCLFLSCANLFFRDVKYIVQVLLTFGIFFTPVLYDPALLGPTGAKLVMLNPIAPILEGLRLTIFHSHSLLDTWAVTNRHGIEVVTWSPWYLAYSLAWAFGGLSIAAVLFHRAEFAFAEYV